MVKEIAAVVDHQILEKLQFRRSPSSSLERAGPHAI
jgi:hypothetical protein